MTGPVLIRGIGDVGSAVAHVLHRAGWRVALHDAPCPATHRRGMAFADALYDGEATLERVIARRIDDLAALERCWTAGDVAASALPFEAVLGAVPWSVLVDARMRKRAVPEMQRGLAPLVIGLGPGFVAGGHVDVAIETSWDRLGAVLRMGATMALAGEPNPIAGVGRERLVYAPCDGMFRTERRLGDKVGAGDPVATVGGRPLHAPISGVLRGLTRGGIDIVRGTKVIEVDPRGDPAKAFGLGERPRRIGEAVLSVVAELSSGRTGMLRIDRASPT